MAGREAGRKRAVMPSNAMSVLTSAARIRIARGIARLTAERGGEAERAAGEDELRAQRERFQHIGAARRTPLSIITGISGHSATISGSTRSGAIAPL